MSRVVVIGAGAMGLAAAYRAVKLGHQVDLIEASPEPGGMAGHFDFDGISIERFYHFVCKADATTFALMKELGIADKMRWRATSMAYWLQGRLVECGFTTWWDKVSMPSRALTFLQEIRDALDAADRLIFFEQFRIAALNEPAHRPAANDT